MSAEPAPASDRAAPIALWRAARAFLDLLYNLFGAPEHVAALHTLSARTHALMAAWVRAGEAMLRRLLLIEAAAYPKPNRRALLKVSRKRQGRLQHFSCQCPEQWRVSFRCFLDRPRRPRMSRWRGAPKRRFYDAWPLAERMEALIRVFNDPAPYARRLAARLHATPHRGQTLLAAPAPARIPGAPAAAAMIGGDVFAQLGEAARAALACFDTS